MTLYIVIITIVISIAAFQYESIYHRFIFNPYSITHRQEWYRFITSGFIHADWIHLGVNMLVLYQFGSRVEYFYEAVFGTKGWYYFLILYLGGILIAILPSYKKHREDPYYNGLGASGAVSAVLFTEILFNPWEKVYLFGLLGLPGIVFAVAYLIYSYYMDRKGNDNINHNAHFWGAVFGVVYTLALKPSIFLHFIRTISDAI
jgi:membrane associated rhomboid family serine protease